MTLQARRPNTAGFTLLEILLAFGILLLGMLPILGLLASAMRTSKTSTDIVNASVLGSSVLADLKAQGDWSALPVEDEVHPTYPDYKYTLRVIHVSDTAAAAHVEVVISWNSPMGMEILRMRSVVLQREP